MSALFLALALSALSADETLVSHGVRVHAAAGVSPDAALLEDLALGLRALPPSFRSPPDGALVVELDPRPSPFGMGDGTAARPEWRGGRFVLYAYAEPDEPRALFRLEGLDPAARQRVWRRRAIVHALMASWDARLRWSERTGWKRITGWDGAPGNPYEWAYSRRRGMHSASLDLVTFAEEALVPAESVASTAVPLDDQLRCQEFSKTRYLRQRLGGGGVLPTTSAECPAFARWADLEHLVGVDLLLSAPSGQRLQSLFGHLMLRPVYANAAGVTRRQDPIIEVAALTGPAEPTAQFIVRGVTGGYLNAFGALTPGAIRSEHVDREERNVRRWSLDLNVEERRRLMERLWEAERRGYHPYRFFTENCATYVGFILNGAVDEHRMAAMPWPLVMPTAVIDAFAPSRQGPLFVSHRDVAVASQQRQDVLLARLSKLAPGQRAAWRSYLSGTRSTAPRTRYPAYARLPGLAAETIAQAPAAAPLVIEIAEASLLLERYAAQSLRRRMDEIDLARVVLPADVALPRTAELVSERQRRYQRETGTDRMGESLRRSLQWAGFFARLPRRTATPEELTTAESAALTVDTFLSLATIYADLVDRYGSAPARVEPAAPWPKTNSGLGRLALGAAIERTGGVDAALAVLRTAFIAERLGERRENGMDPLAELVFLDTELRLRVGGALPSVHRVDATLARIRTLPREPSLTREHLWSALGYGAGASSSASGDGRQAHLAWAEGIVPLLHAPEYEHHLILAAGPAVRLAGGGWLPDEGFVGGRVELGGRAQLSNSTPLSARVLIGWTPSWRVVGGAQVWSHDARAVATVELARSARSAAQVELQLGGTWTWEGTHAERTLGATILIGTP